MSLDHIERNRPFDFFNARLKYLVRYNFIADKFKTFLDDNSIFNEYKFEYESDFCTLYEKIDEFLENTKDDHKRIVENIEEKLYNSDAFLSLYNEFLEELNLKLDGYEECMMLSMKNIYAKIKNKEFPVNKDEIFGIELNFIKKSFEKRFDCFFETYVYFYHLIEISDKFNLNESTKNEIKEMHEIINSRMLFLGFFLRKKKKLSLFCLIILIFIYIFCLN